MNNKFRQIILSMGILLLTVGCEGYVFNPDYDNVGEEYDPEIPEGDYIRPDSNYLWGCIDTMATNYSDIPDYNDGTCIYDNVDLQILEEIRISIGGCHSIDYANPPANCNSNLISSSLGVKQIWENDRLVHLDMSWDSVSVPNHISKFTSLILVSELTELRTYRMWDIVTTFYGGVYILSATIPNSLTNLTNLDTLHLRNGGFYGDITSEMCDFMMELDELAISCNHLRPIDETIYCDDDFWGDQDCEVQ